MNRGLLRSTGGGPGLVQRGPQGPGPGLHHSPGIRAVADLGSPFHAMAIVIALSVSRPGDLVTGHRIEKLKVERHLAGRPGINSGSARGLNIRSMHVEIDDSGPDDQDIFALFIRHFITPVNQFLGHDFAEQSSDIFGNPEHVTVFDPESMNTVLITFPVFSECNRGILEPNTFVDAEVGTRVRINGCQFRISDKFHAFVIDGW